MGESAPKPGPTGSTWAEERSEPRHAQAERPNGTDTCRVAPTERSSGRASAVSNTYWSSDQASERSRSEPHAGWRKFAQEDYTTCTNQTGAVWTLTVRCPRSVCQVALLLAGGRGTRHAAQMSIVLGGLRDGTVHHESTPVKWQPPGSSDEFSRKRRGGGAEHRGKVRHGNIHALVECNIIGYESRSIEESLLRRRFCFLLSTPFSLGFLIGYCCGGHFLV